LRGTVAKNIQTQELAEAWVPAFAGTAREANTKIVTMLVDTDWITASESRGLSFRGTSPSPLGKVLRLLQEVPSGGGLGPGFRRESEGKNLLMASSSRLLHTLSGDWVMGWLPSVLNHAGSDCFRCWTGLGSISSRACEARVALPLGLVRLVRHRVFSSSEVSQSSPFTA
jgi:hypothetical protein